MVTLYAFGDVQFDPMTVLGGCKSLKRNYAEDYKYYDVGRNKCVEGQSLSKPGSCGVTLQTAVTGGL